MSEPKQKYRDPNRSPLTAKIHGPWISKAFFCKAYRDKPPISYTDCFFEIAQEMGQGGKDPITGQMVVEFIPGGIIGKHRLEIVCQEPNNADRHWIIVDGNIEFFEGMNAQTLHIEAKIRRNILGTWFYYVTLDNAVYVRIPMLVLPAPISMVGPTHVQA